MKRRKWLARATALLGLTLLVWILAGDGGRTLVRVASALKFTWPLLLLPFFATSIPLLLCYRTFLPDRGRAVPWPVLIHVQRSAAVLNEMLPFGNFGGQVVKVTTLGRWYRSEQLVAVAVWGLLSVGVCNSVGAIGPLVLFAMGHAEQWIVGLLALVNLMMALPATGILLLVRKGLSQRITKLLARIRIGALQRRRDKMLAWASRLDTHLASAVGDRKRDFWRGNSFRALAQVARITEIWMVMRLLDIPHGMPDPRGIAVAVLYNALSRSTSQILSFVPARLGVLEATTMTGLAALGYGSTTGLELTLALRFRYIVSIATSALALSTLSSTVKKYAASTPAPAAETIPAAPDAIE